MDQDEKNALQVEYNKEREICAGANASEYHQKKFDELKKQLKITDGDGKVEKPKEAPKEKPATVESTTASDD